MDLLSGTVLESHKAFIAEVLENNLPATLQSYYSNLALSSILNNIEKYNDNIE
jgi:hypothetical protein